MNKQVCRQDQCDSHEFVNNNTIIIYSNISHESNFYKCMYVHLREEWIVLTRYYIRMCIVLECFTTCIDISTLCTCHFHFLFTDDASAATANAEQVFYVHIEWLHVTSLILSLGRPTSGWQSCLYANRSTNCLLAS